MDFFFKKRFGRRQQNGDTNYIKLNNSDSGNKDIYITINFEKNQVLKASP